MQGGGRWVTCNFEDWGIIVLVIRACRMELWAYLWSRHDCCSVWVFLFVKMVGCERHLCCFCQGFVHQKDYLRRLSSLCKASEKENVRGINFLEWSGKLIPQGPIVSGELSSSCVGFGSISVSAFCMYKEASRWNCIDKNSPEAALHLCIAVAKKLFPILMNTGKYVVHRYMSFFIYAQCEF